MLQSYMSWRNSTAPHSDVKVLFCPLIDVLSPISNLKNDVFYVNNIGMACRVLFSDARPPLKEKLSK